VRVGIYAPTTVAVWLGFCDELFVTTPLGFLIDHKKIDPFNVTIYTFRTNTPNNHLLNQANHLRNKKGLILA
jgi:hypothetical protein